MFRLVLHKKTTTLLTVVVLVFALKSLAYGEMVNNSSLKCVDLLLVFARGSSQNQNHNLIDNPFDPKFKDLEAESSKFFLTFKEQLDRDYPHVDYKAVSIHNFPNKYAENGYRAVPAFNWANFHKNAINADASWYPGNYRKSVEEGVWETMGYIKDEVARCPNQKIVAGGYSQGAQVLGDSLFRFTETELAQIEGVAFFGDPKFVASTDNPWNPFDKGVVYPWKRGTAADNDRGSADARIPYVPPSMENKTLSWCFDDDFVCSGYSGVRKQMDEGHSRYSYFGVQQAAIEITQRIAPKLYAIERAKGGVDKGAGPSQPIPYQPSARPIDLMFLVNTSYNVNDVLGLLRIYTDQVMPPFNYYFENTRYGIADFTELSYGNKPIYTPQINTRQNFKPYSTEPNNLAWNFVRGLSYGTTSGGGVDPPDPHILAIERVSTLPSWKPEATKHVLLITDRPMKETITYNICDQVVRTGLGITQTNNCLNTPSIEEMPASYHSEICNLVWDILTSDICRQEFIEPTSTRDITRTMQDAIGISMANKIAVSIVVPHPIIETADKELTEKQLEYFAKATGGLFIKYNSFNTASYSDMIWQVLNHQPKQIELAYKDALKVLGEYEQIKASRHVLGKTNVPMILDVSGSTAAFSGYKWDFNGDEQWDEQTLSPTIQHTFDEPVDSGLMRVAGVDENGEEGATLTLPITIEEYDGPEVEEAEVLRIPSNIKAIVGANGNVTLSWEGGEDGTAVVAGDPLSGLPVHSTPAEQGFMTFSADDPEGNEVIVWVISDTGSSERVVISIEADVTDNAAPQNVEEKMVTSESAPWSQYLGESDGASPAGGESAQTAQSGQTSSGDNGITTADVSSPAEVAGARTDAQDIVEDNDAKKHLTNVSNFADIGNIKTNKPLIVILVILFTIAGAIFAARKHRSRKLQ